MLSAATDAGMRSRPEMVDRPRSISARSAPSLTRASTAIRVAIPPGWTQVTERLGQPAHGELAGDVGALLGRGDQTEDAGQVDEMRSRVLQQDRDQRMRQGEDSAEVDLHQPVELLQGQVGEGSGQGHAGVVDHQCELRVLARQPSAEHDRGLVITEVGDDGVDP